MKNKRLWILIVGSLLLTSCAVTDNHDSPTEAQKKTEITKDNAVGFVTRDMLAVLTQLLTPRTTTIQLSKPVTVFGEELEHGLREIGYGMQRVTADQGPSYLSYSEQFKSTSKAERTFTYELFVGNVGVRRQYIVVPDVGIYPGGPMYVLGTDKEVQVNDQIFAENKSNAQYLNSVQYVNKSAALESYPTLEIITSELVKSIASTYAGDLPSYSALNFQNKKIENLFATGSSNFTSVSQDFRIVRKEIIIFDNDSLKLQTKGKSQVTSIVQLFNNETDVVRLIGCSNGYTEYDGGNVGLALGRSKRIAKELVANGLSSESILDEGCWAPTTGVQDLPNRGVVVELKRKT